jgi:hypothetical protein
VSQEIKSFLYSVSCEIASIKASYLSPVAKAGFDPMQPRAEDGTWIDSRLLDVAKTDKNLQSFLRSSLANSVEVQKFDEWMKKPVERLRRNDIRLGRDYWQEYVNVNGYAFAPNQKGINQLSAKIGLPPSHLSRCITAYLEM